MKKQLLIAAVAATMTSVAFADISISGSANLKMGAASGLWQTVSTNVIDDGTLEYSNMAMDIEVVGKAGGTTVNAHIDIDNAGYIQGYGYSVAEEEAIQLLDPTYSNTDKGVINIDKLWIETDIGAVHVKGGDYASCVGMVEAVKKCTTTDNTITLSTDLADWTVGFTSNMKDSSAKNAYTASGKIGDTAVKIKHKEDTYTNLSVNASLSGIGIYAEYMDNDDATNSDTFVTAISGKAGNVGLSVAYLNADDEAATVQTGDIRLLGSSLIGDYHTAAYATTYGMTDVFAVGANFDVAGNNINIVTGKADTVTGVRDSLNFADIVLQRKLASGATLDLSYGKADSLRSEGALETAGAADSTTNYGAQLTVKF